MKRSSHLTLIDLNGPYQEKEYDLSRAEYGAAIKKTGDRPLNRASKVCLGLAVVFTFAAIVIKFTVAK